MTSTLFVVDPIGVVPSYLIMTRADPLEKRRQMVRRASLVATAALLVFATGGGAVLRIFGVGLPAFRIAGGIVLGIVALDMMRALRQTQERPDEVAEGAAKDDVADTPLAIPMLAGPAALSTVTLLMNQATSWTQASIVYAVILVTGLSTYIILRLAETLHRWLGQTGIHVVSRILGLVLLLQEIALLREEIRIKDARLARIDAHRRPHYPPTERMAILQLREARNWSLQQTAKTFLVTSETVAFWMTRVDEAGDAALVQLAEPVNKFPAFVGAMVQRLKTLCPTRGKKKIAETLCRAGLHLGVTTVGRMMKAKPQPTSSTPPAAAAERTQEAPSATQPIGDQKKRVVTAKCRNHVWHVDLTLVPILGGFWTSWVPFALPQRWPFCWWVAVVVDHFSRRCMGVAVFKTEPTSEAVRTFLGRAIHRAGRAPKYIVSDKGPQFRCPGFQRWCKRHKIQPPRFGAVGKHGSIAVVERFILTLKTLCTRVILVTLRSESMREELRHFQSWYNSERPHTTLNGATPDEVCFRRHPACRHPRFEPRPLWPRRAPCAGPNLPIRGSPGQRLELSVEPIAGQKHLPIVTLRRAA